MMVAGKAKDGSCEDEGQQSGRRRSTIREMKDGGQGNRKRATVDNLMLFTLG